MFLYVYTYSLELKISDLEKEIKNIRFKADLHSNIEKDITKRRAMTMNLKIAECSTQTDDQPVVIDEVISIKQQESKSEDGEIIKNSIRKDRVIQTISSKAKAVMKRSQSIGKIERLKSRFIKKKKRNNSEVD